MFTYIMKLYKQYIYTNNFTVFRYSYNYGAMTDLRRWGDRFRAHKDVQTNMRAFHGKGLGLKLEACVARPDPGSDNK